MPILITFLYELQGNKPYMFIYEGKGSYHFM